MQFLEKNETFYKQKNIPIEIVLSVDGLPISRSSGGQVWPILGSIYNFTEVFIMVNQKKPDDSNIFMEDFVVKAKNLVENGLTFNNHHYRCLLKMLCADAPAKAFVLNVKSHTGYSSCTKCTEKGEYQNRRMAFSDKPSRLRTDEDFTNKTSEGYHIKPSSLEEIPKFGLVSNVPFDYLHLICLGMVKKLINLWLCDDLMVRLTFRKVQIIKVFLIFVNGKLVSSDNFYYIVDQQF